MQIEKTWLGLSPFAHSWDIQIQKHRLIQESKDLYGTIIGQEHPEVITLGRSSQASDFPAELNIMQHADRGGKATLHSPGQLVIYPVMPIRRKGWGVAAFIHSLAEVTAEWGDLLNCPLEFRPHDPGFFVEDEKVGFIGIRVKNGITLHGLSLNIHNDLSLFRKIVSCGQTDRKIGKIDTTEDLKTLFERWTEIAQKTWQKVT